MIVYKDIQNLSIIKNRHLVPNIIQYLGQGYIIMNKEYKENIQNYIGTFDSDYVFIAQDFFTIADYETVRKTLNRLVNDGYIQRIINGVYYKPKYIEAINEYKAPNIDEVAHAIARKYNWTIAPSGNTALNLLGLDTQVPAKWTYISDGRYVAYSFNGVTIEFKKRSNINISKMSQNTAMVIQALKTIGNGNVTDEHISHLQKILTQEQKIQLLEESKYACAWVYNIIRQISGATDE